LIYRTNLFSSLRLSRGRLAFIVWRSRGLNEFSLVCPTFFASTHSSTIRLSRKTFGHTVQALSRWKLSPFSSPYRAALAPPPTVLDTTGMFFLLPLFSQTDLHMPPSCAVSSHLLRPSGGPLACRVPVNSSILFKLS